jgi:hypothetical protein
MYDLFQLALHSPSRVKPRVKVFYTEKECLWGRLVCLSIYFLRLASSYRISDSPRRDRVTEAGSNTTPSPYRKPIEKSPSKIAENRGSRHR